MRWRTSPLAAALLLAVAPATADAPIRLDYDAPDGCPTKVDLLSAMQARTSQLRFATAAPRTRGLRLRVERDAGSFRGTLEVIEVDGASTHREIRAATCETVVTALALVAALSLDPLADAAAPAPSSRVPAVAAPPSDTPPPTPAPGPVVPSSPPPVVAPPPQVRVLERSSEPEMSPAPSPAQVHLGVGAAVQLLGLAAGQPVFGADVFAELSVERASVLSPSFRLGFERAEGGSLTDGAKSTHFTWLIGRAEACPTRVRFGRSVALRPCLGVDAGSIAATTTNDPSPRDPVRAWVDGSVVGRLEWRVLSRLSLEATGGIRVPLVRDTFEIKSDASGTSYTAPGIVGTGSLGASVLFL